MPEATAAAIVTQADSPSQGDGPSKDSCSAEILLTRRAVAPFRGQWCLPGGHIDLYEPARAAVVREVKEETGLDFDARFFGYFDEIIPERGIHAVVIVFEGPGTSTLSAQQEEVSEIGWFPLDEARSLPLAFTHNEILDAYAARRKRERL